MKSFYYLLGAAAIALASCSESTELETNPINNLAAKGTAIAFNTYQAQSTRAGATGSITTDVLKGADYGFGVFAYSTGDANYAAGIKPNWMYNEQVLWNSTNNAWEYSPVKYWPNDNTVADNQDAVGTTSSKLSFFAYAPYVGDDANDGKLAAGETSGITALSAPDATTHPTVTYTLAETGKQVDLLWGTAGEDSYASVTGTASVPAKVTTDSKAATNINITKTPIDTKIKFNFKHALAKIGGSNEVDPTTGKPYTYEQTSNQSGLQVQLDIDKDGAITGGSKADETVVTIKTIKIVNDGQGTTDYDGDGNVDADDNIYREGTLDLATGLWTMNTTSTPAVINHVVTSPGSEATDITNKAAEIASNLAEPVSVAKTEAGFNGLPTGVQTNPLNVYGAETNPLVFIPGTAPAFKITVEYVVRTKDKHLADAYSEAVQNITHTVAFPTVELNKKYNLIMHLGLTSVKFDATVSDWDATSVSDADPDGDADGDGIKNSEDPDYAGNVHLPINVK